MLDSDTSSNGDFPAMVVILTNLSTTFTFSPGLEKAVFNIAGIPYCPPRTPKDREFLEEMKKLCYDKIYEALETNYEIILLNNTPLTLQVIKELREKTDQPNASDWLILSFFHEDKALANNKVQVTDTEYLNPQILLDIKSKDIESLSDYPFVKKIYIPHGSQIIVEPLKTLFETRARHHGR